MKSAYALDPCSTARGVFGEKSTSMSYKFTGQERDAETGNDNFQARYYGSTSGRFMSPDPSGLAFANLSDPQTLNPYSYVYNQPTDAVDLNGLWPTQIHNQIIENAFGSFLTSHQIQILEKASRHQDGLFNGGQSARLSYLHGMVGVGGSRIKAMQDASDFARHQTLAVRRIQGVWNGDAASLSDEALKQFGYLLHLFEDERSPAHRGFQVWNPWSPLGIYRHHELEKGPMTQAQESETLATAALAFFDVFMDVDIDASTIQSAIGWGDQDSNNDRGDGNNAPTNQPAPDNCTWSYGCGGWRAVPVNDLPDESPHD
jgi:RHS repeat-associated protein